ncbi:MAG: exonuclease SbcCD subunit D [Bacteroidota bacterium]|jgi:DNA repair exonuclease SbcCD nuclease subunit
MNYRFLHIADVHLGRHQHSSPERYADYFAVLGSVVEYALHGNVDAVLIAGDLFDEQEPSAETLRRAMEVLRPLRDAGVDVCAIEGNHDRRKRTEPAGALDLLDSEGYLRLLSPRFAEHAIVLDPYEHGSSGAVWSPRDGLVIAGLGFIPHNIEEYFAQTAALLPADSAVILLAHVMLARGEDALEYGCVAAEDIDPLREHVTYLALGHRHTRMGIEGETDGWIFNPGSLEYVNTLDYRMAAELRGFYDVTVGEEFKNGGLKNEELKNGELKNEELKNGELENGVGENVSVKDGLLETMRGTYRISVRHVPTEKRPAFTLRVDISGCAQPEDVTECVRRAADEQVDDALRARQPILVVRLQGTPALSRVRIPRAAITELLRTQYNALHVEVMDRDLMGSAGPAVLLADEGGLEQVADRARVIAADLFIARGIAHGREAELAAVLLDLKAQLHGVAKSPSDTVLERMREQLRPFVEGEDVA